MPTVRCVLRLLLSAYHKVLSPLLPQSCRYYPTCSTYTAEAIEKHGILKGLYYGLRRIARCHPGYDGGYDPVK